MYSSVRKPSESRRRGGMGCSVKWDGAFNVRGQLVSSTKAVEPQLDTVERELCLVARRVIAFVEKYVFD